MWKKVRNKSDSQLYMDHIFWNWSHPTYLMNETLLTNFGALISKIVSVLLSSHALTLNTMHFCFWEPFVRSRSLVFCHKQQKNTQTHAVWIWARLQISVQFSAHFAKSWFQGHNYDQRQKKIKHEQKISAFTATKQQQKITMKDSMKRWFCLNGHLMEYLNRFSTPLQFVNRIIKTSFDIELLLLLL